MPRDGALPFTQTNVFSADPLGGNPLAVVHAAEGLKEAQMAALARWTNLSETTFLLPPTEPDWAQLDPLKLGVIGPHDDGHDAAFKVRALVGASGYEDPVTGSLNAGAGVGKKVAVAGGQVSISGF